MKRFLAKGAFTLALTGLSAPFVRAEGVRSEVDARRIGLEDTLELTVTVEGRAPDDLALPPLTNLKVVGGPSTASQVSIMNGQMTQSRTWTWVLKPGAVGKAEVGPVRARLGGSEEVAPAIPVEVVPGSVKPARPRRRMVDPFGDQDPMESVFGRRRERPEPKLLIEAVPSRNGVYVGEPLLLTYYLYTQTTVTDLQFTEAPQYTGFWVEDLERPQTSASGESVMVGGVPYRRFPLILKLLHPTRAGKLTLPTATMRIAIPAQGFFDSGSVVERSTKPVTIEVKAIPDEPGFSGAVGRFRASSSLDRDTLALGEAATLRFKVDGGGNLKWIDRGPGVAVEGARVYPPQTKSDLKAGPGGFTGSKTWEFVIVPQTTGVLEVPALALSFFDPAAGKLTKAETKPLSLRVEGGTAAAGVPAPAAPRVAAARGPLPLRAGLDRPRMAVPVLGGRVVAAALALTLLLHAGLFLASSLGQRRRGAEGRTAAPRRVRASLRELERVGKDGMSKEAAAALIEKTLHEAFGALDGDESERARAVARLLEEIHKVRYAPQLGDYSEKLRELAGRAADVVRRWA